MIITASCQFPDPMKSLNRPARPASCCVNLNPPLHSPNIIPPLSDYLVPTFSRRKQPLSSILPPRSRPRTTLLPARSRPISSVFTVSRKRVPTPKRRNSLPPLKRTLLPLQESVRRYSEEYEDGDEMEKKRSAATTPLRRFGSALHASFKLVNISFTFILMSTLGGREIATLPISIRS